MLHDFNLVMRSVISHPQALGTLKTATELVNTVKNSQRLKSLVSAEARLKNKPGLVLANATRFATTFNCVNNLLENEMVSPDDPYRGGDVNNISCLLLILI